MNKQKDVIDFLKNEHRNVEDAFDAFVELGPQAYKSKKSLADKICTDLEVHTQIEEEIFYPAFRKAAPKERPLADEAKVEHDSSKALIQDIKKMKAEDDLFDAKVKVLSEHIAHHIKEEENEMFPLMKKSSDNLVELGERMESRKQELM